MLEYDYYVRTLKTTSRQKKLLQGMRNPNGVSFFTAGVLVVAHLAPRGSGVGVAEDDPGDAEDADAVQEIRRVGAMGDEVLSRGWAAMGSDGGARR